MQPAPSETRLYAESADCLARWVEAHDYRAYDPGDGDLSFLRSLTLGNHLLKRLLTGVVLRSPFHIRPWIGIRPHTSTKGMGYMAWGYTKMHRLTGDRSFRERADRCLSWLVSHRAPGEKEFCWGNHFDFSTRAGTIPRHTPTLVWSSLIALAFLDAYEELGNEQYLDVAASTARWTLRLPREVTSSGSCISYVPGRQSSIHNSNLLGASLLARVAGYTGNRECRDVAAEAVRYTCSRQEPGGAWFYGEDPKYHWIDSFHTGYNLDSLQRYQHSSGDHQFEPNLRSGFSYFLTNFFEKDGRPKYYHDRTLPIDIQCAAQAIDTLAYLSAYDPDALSRSRQVAAWTIRHMQDPDGHFYYRDLGWRKVKTPMLHWGQGTMFKALAQLLLSLAEPIPGAATANPVAATNQ